MATFSLAHIVIHHPPAGSSFVAGDTLDIYFDAVLFQVTVFQDGLAFVPDANSYIGAATNNYDISYGVSSYIFVDGSTYAVAAFSVCMNSTLVWFRMLLNNPTFPYFQLMQTENSPVCDIGGGVVCDIAWDGPVEVTNTTNLTAPNGAIRGVAVSGNGTVKYGLTDFHYPSEGQLSGDFSGLGVGEYTLYAKDVHDCTIKVGVSILYKPQEEEHYRCTYRTLSTGEGTPRWERIRIFEREYIGVVVEVEYSEGSVFEFNKPKQGELNDKFFPIHPTQATLALVSERDSQWLPLHTQDDKKFRIVREILEDSTWTEVWQGYISPSTNQENFAPGVPTTVQLQMSDNVKQLENEDFTDGNGNFLYGKMKLIAIIAHIMKKTGLNLKIRSSINIFEITHTIESDGSSDPLDQTYLDVACYIDSEGIPFKCWQVLEAIFRPFGARILQEDGQWIIEEVDRATASYDYRIFDENGVYESNSTFDPLLDVKNPDEIERVVLAGRDHSREIIPAYGRIDVLQKLNYVGSFPTGGFEKRDLLTPNAEVLSTSQGVYTTEEGFRGWTLRLNGTAGVSFGRVQVGISREKMTTEFRGQTTVVGVISKGAVQVESEDRSVGAFFFGSAWDGNVRDAYIESAPQPYQYGPADSLKLKFEYAAPGGTSSEYEFIVLRFMIKLGNQYLQQDKTWDVTEYVWRAYPSKLPSFEVFELDVPVPETEVVVDTYLRVRIYYYAKDFYDYGLPSATADVFDGTNGVHLLKTLPTAGIDYEYKVDVRHESSPEVFRIFAQLKPGSSESESLPYGAIRPNDYDGVTNERVWDIINAIRDGNWLNKGSRSSLEKKFYIDNVAVDSFPNGQPPPSESLSTLIISKSLNEKLTIELYHGDVPEGINNAKNMYNNFFKLADGSPTTLWTRVGVAEQLPLRLILLKVVGSNHAAPTFRLTGSFLNEFSRIKLTNYLKITQLGSPLALVNTDFASNLTGWDGDAAGEPFVWVADNGGSAEVALSGIVDSEKLTQEISHPGGYIQVTGNVHIIPAADNDREDTLWLLFYRNGDIIHTEKITTFTAPQVEDDYEINYKAFVPSDIDEIGFYIRRTQGDGQCTYQFGEFNPDGVDIDEIYQIADYLGNSRIGSATLELMQMSKSYINLAGVDQGGNGQSGGGQGDFSGDFNDDFGGDFDTTTN